MTTTAAPAKDGSLDACGQEVHELSQAAHYDRAIARVREIIEEHGAAAFRNWHLKEWCGLRWRNLFLTEALEDEGVRELLENEDRDDEEEGHPSARRRIAERFLRGHGCTEWNVGMPSPEAGPLEKTTLVYCPGLFHGIVGTEEFPEEFSVFSVEAGNHQIGNRLVRARTHPLAGSDHNAAAIAAAVERGSGLDARGKLIERSKASPPQEVVLIGFSKGGADIVEFLISHPELAGKVRAVFNIAGALAGSYLADETWQALQGVASEQEQLALAAEKLGPFSPLPPQSRNPVRPANLPEAVLHLTTLYREKFLHENEDALDALGIPFFFLTATVNPMEASARRVAGAVRLGHYEADNDTLLTRDQAHVDLPAAVEIAMLHSNHWNLAYSVIENAPRGRVAHIAQPFPRRALLQACRLLGQELGLIS